MKESGGVGVCEFEGEDVGQVLRLLARQAKITMVVSEAVQGTVTMRLEDFTALQAIAIIMKAKSFFMDQIENVYDIKTAWSAPRSRGTTGASPIIATRTLNSNILIKSGDSLAIGGLLQDEMAKSRSKVPDLGDVPVLGYFFQERLNARTKRNLLVFVTPTILERRCGTGLEVQVGGLDNGGEEFADPNGWRSIAIGAARVVPTSNRQSSPDYPKPGVDRCRRRSLHEHGQGSLLTQIFVVVGLRDGWCREVPS